MFGNPNVARATAMFEAAGFKVIQVLPNKSQEEMFIISPANDEELEEYGRLVLSPRAMEAVGKAVADSK